VHGRASLPASRAFAAAETGCSSSSGGEAEPRRCPGIAGLEPGGLPEPPGGRFRFRPAGSCPTAPPPRLADCEAELETRAGQLPRPPVYGDEAGLTRVLERQEVVLERFEALGGSSHRSRVIELLDRPGTDACDHARDASTPRRRARTSIDWYSSSRRIISTLPRPRSSRRGYSHYHDAKSSG
jgi:hypothetical protein